MPSPQLEYPLNMWTRILIFKHFLLHLKRTFGNFAKMIAACNVPPFWKEKKCRILFLLSIPSGLGETLAQVFFPSSLVSGKYGIYTKTWTHFENPSTTLEQKFSPSPLQQTPVFGTKWPFKKTFFPRTIREKKVQLTSIPFIFERICSYSIWEKKERTAFLEFLLNATGDRLALEGISRKRSPNWKRHIYGVPFQATRIGIKFVM